MKEYTTLKEIVKQLEFANYRTVDGLHDLKNNAAFISLQKLAENESRPVDGVVINFLPDAVKIVTKAIREDKDLYIAYQANIAMPFQDEFKRQMGQIGRNEAIENIHQIANNAAKYFLDLWCKE